MPTPPPNSENEVWYVVPGRHARPRNRMTRPQTAATTRAVGKAREAGRGSRSDAAPADTGNHGAREGRGEGRRAPADPTQMRSTSSV